MIEGISGIELCRRLRRMPATTNLPIIMLTARGEEDDVHIRRLRMALGEHGGSDLVRTVPSAGYALDAEGLD